MPETTRHRGPWWQINARAANDRQAEILIYSDIGESWDGETVAARTFVQALTDLDADTLTVRINSYGGSVTDGLAIYNALRRHPATVGVEIDGIAASIASLIAMAGDTVRMADNALLMIHAPWGMAMGNATDMREMADTLDRYAQAMSGAYARPGGLEAESVLSLLNDGKDHWYSAQEARDAGLIDDISPALAIAASVPARFRPAGALTEVKPMADKQPIPPAVDPSATTQTLEPAQTPAATSAQTQAPSESDIQARAQQMIHAHHQALETAFAPVMQDTSPHAALIREHVAKARADLTQTPDKVRAAILAELGRQSGEPRHGASYTRAYAGEDQRDKLVAACTTALLARAALHKPDAKDQVNAVGNPFMGKSLVRIAEDSLVRAGVQVDGLDSMRIVGMAFTQTGADFPVLLENTMHKAMQDAYAIASDTWRRFCAVGSVSDFRAHNRYMVGSLGDLQDVNEAGEIPNVAIPDGRKQSVSIGTKGHIINLTRQAIINDDLGAFVGLAAARGRAAARTIENAVYTAIGLNSGYGPLLSDGKSIMHADHGNIAATGGAPSVITVEAGVLKMSEQKDISGQDYLDLTPAIMLVPKALEVTARILNTATNDPNAVNTTSSKNFLVPNPFMGYFADIVASPRLAATKWYMLANPAVAPVLEVSFLNGVQAPLMEMELGFSVDGARWRTRLDFGVSGVGYEGIVYNAGQ